MNQEWKEWVTIQRSFTCICCGYIAFQGDSCHVCGMLKEGDARFANRDWWHSFVARGAGTWPSARPSCGFHHHLENLLSEQSTLQHVDEAVVNYPGRPDALVGDFEEMVQREFKAIGAGQPLGKSTVAQLEANVKAALARAASAVGGTPNNAVISEHLERIEYVFRGLRRQDLVDEVRKVVGDALVAAGRDRELAEGLVKKFVFQGKLPF